MEMYLPDEKDLMDYIGKYVLNKKEKLGDDVVYDITFVSNERTILGEKSTSEYKYDYTITINEKNSEELNIKNSDNSINYTCNRK